MDVDRERLDLIAGLARKMAADYGFPAKIESTTQ